mgnify:CR=1 FL=1|tara:strand:+ start:591 stop:767 length:177 start_codon:yes stop_codon:yes gene_type:complete
MACDWSKEMGENSGNGPEHIREGVARVMRRLAAQKADRDSKEPAAPDPGSAVSRSPTS